MFMSSKLRYLFHSAKGSRHFFKGVSLAHATFSREFLSFTPLFQGSFSCSRHFFKGVSLARATFSRELT
jgi:uncharacterized protein YjbI with pentapeptide repeats